MTPYVVLITCICIEYFLIAKSNLIRKRNNRKKLFNILVCIELILFAALRAISVGPDTLQYTGGYNFYKNCSFSQIFTYSDLKYPYDWEYLYFVFTKLVGFFGLDQYAFQAIVACLIYIPTSFLIYKYSENDLTAYLSYFVFNLFQFSMGINRQMIAVSICIFSLKYIRDKKLFKFLITIGTASLFHLSSIVFVLLYIGYKYRNRILKSKVLLWIVPISALTTFFGRSLVENVAIKIMPAYAGYVGGLRDTTGGTYLMLVLYLTLLLYEIILRKKVVKYGIESENDENKFIYYISLISLVFALILQSISYSFNVMGRMTAYFAIFVTILVSNDTDKLFAKRNKALIFFTINVILIVLSMYKISTNQYLIPYKVFG